MRTRGVLLILLCYLISIHYTEAQSTDHSPCGHDWLMTHFKHQHPSFFSASKQLYKSATQNITASADKDFEGIYRIPVVVHVLWRRPVENIPRQQIEEQIQVINEDFRRLNADADKVRPEFESNVVDSKIEFELIEVVRVQTNEIFKLEFDWTNLNFIFPDYLKESDKGGSSPWDVKSYLNIWVCAIAQDAVFGYAYPPSDLDNWPSDQEAPIANYDGIVINHKVFGAQLAPFINAQGDSIALQGRTLTHEVGHYLGLRHPWGDGSAPIGCNLDDGLKDTPNTAQANSFICDHTINSCQDEEDDLPDMIENFMDYSNESCKNSFTRSQATLMRYVLEHNRSELPLKDVPNPKNEEIILYPNPTSSSVTAHITTTNTNYTVSTRSATGQEVYSPVIVNRFGTTRNYRIDLSQLSAGIYFISFTDVNKNVFTKKVVVVR